MKTERIIWTAKFLTVLTLSFLLSLNFYMFETKKINSDPFKTHYISDEVWYVSASRNILREVFHLYPVSSNATIQAKDVVALSKFIGLYSSEFGITESKPYSKIKNAAYVIANSTEGIQKLLKEHEKYNLTLVQPGWIYPDQPGILKYLNLEHPPLAKYFIMHQILIEDKPPSWRVPSVVLGSLVVFVLPVAIYLYTGSLLFSLGTLLLLFFDEPLRAMSMVAMLDIYAGAFSSFSLALLPFSPLLGTIFYALASISKYTAFFYFVPIAYVYWFEKRKSPLGSVLRPLLAFAIALVLSSLPLIIGLGFERWLAKLLWGIHWFLMSRPSGPPPASPLDWILGQAPCPLYINPSLYVYTNSSIMMLALAAFFVLFPLRKRRTYRPAWLASLYLVSALLGFTFVYLAGNKTLYTFYVVVFTPMADVAAAGLVPLMMNWDDAADAVDWWSEAIRKAIRWLRGEERLVCRLERPS